MTTNPSSPAKPELSPPSEHRDQTLQTGALAGGQPGQGANTSSSATGQSNADAAAEQGTEYGKHDSADEQRVREAAYRRFQERGSVHGHHEEDWMAAERETRPAGGN